MLNPNLLKFILKNNLEESRVEEKKEVKAETSENKMFTYSRFAAIPIEIVK